MAQLFTALLGAIGGTGATATAAAATTAAASTGSFLTTAFSVASTVVGGLASIASGRQEQAMLERQAFDEETKATQEMINGRQEALTAMRKLNQDLAQITVAGYGSGLAPEGSIEAAREEALATGEANVNMARENASYAAAARRGQAAQLRMEGRAARSRGVMGAIQGGLSLFSRNIQRG